MTRALVLLYHRVASPAVDPFLLCVREEHFREQIEVLSRSVSPVTLAEYLAATCEGRDLGRCAVITFDDGYADNLHVAAPVLRARGVPAVFFVTSGQIGLAKEFWWDSVSRILLSFQALPSHLRLVVGDAVLECDLEGSAHDGGAQARHRDWNVLDSFDPTARQRLCRQLCDVLRPLDAMSRADVVARLHEWASVPLKARESHRVLDAAELRRLDSDDLFEVGLHTLTHGCLRSLGPEERIREVVTGKSRLEELLKHAIASFAYPFGGAADYDRNAVELVKQAEFASACTTRPGIATRDTSPWEIPRHMVFDWNGEEFARRLAEWLP